MKHSDRTFSIKAIENESDLAEVMTGHKWPLCQAFDYGGFLFLNDGDTEGKPEYVALKIDHLESTLAIGKEVGNIEPLGMELIQVKHFIQELCQGQWRKESPLEVKVEPEWHHNCELCRFEED